MCSSSFSPPALPLVVVCRPPPPLSSSSLSYALFDCCVCFIFRRRCRRGCRHCRHHRRRRHPSSVVMSPPPLPLPLGVGCPRRRRLTRLVMARARGVGVVDVAFSLGTRRRGARGRRRCRRPPPRSSSSAPLDGAILNALSRYAHTALALTPSSTPWASALLEGSASNASLRCSVRLGGDGE